MLAEMSTTTQNASEHRGVQETPNDFLNNGPSSSKNHTEIVLNTNNVSNQRPASSTLFSNIVKTTKYPKKDQAIVFPALDGITVKDIVYEMAEKMDPQNIRFASRMSNNRICVYLSSREQADAFVTDFGGVNIGDTFITARKLITPAKRIVLSNVSPCIPDFVIEDAFKAINLKTVTPITNIGAGYDKSKLRHVMSFRRQVYASLGENESIPSSLLINYDGEETRIFLSDDQMTCFKCKRVGHIAAKCPNNEPPVPQMPLEDASTQKRPLSPSTSTTESQEPIVSAALDMQAQAAQNNTESPKHKEDRQGNIKRLRLDPHSTDNTDSAQTKDLIHFEEQRNEQSISTDGNEPFMRPADQLKTIRPSRPHTKLTTQLSVDDFDVFNDIENLWPNDSYVLDFVTFTDFLKEVKGNNQPLLVAQKYTDNVSELINIIIDARRAFKTRALKERCKRLLTNLRKNLKSGGKDLPESLRSSQTSLYDRSRSPSVDSQRSGYAEDMDI